MTQDRRTFLKTSALAGAAAATGVPFTATAPLAQKAAGPQASPGSPMARGFVFAAPVAYRRGAGFVPVRKAGKLPWEIEREEYELEYGTDLLEIHRDAVYPGERVLIVDDVIATGGTAAATARLVERLGGIVVGLAFLIELVPLGGRAQLEGRRVEAVIAYE